ncbi:MAG: phosphoserine phosphatase SerB [Flaviflexus sp.]|nr:phosphoserine phosphatase SerB [Flaviflexus sp.]
MKIPGGGAGPVRLGLASSRPLPTAYLEHARLILGQAATNITFRSLRAPFPAATFVGELTGEITEAWLAELISPATAVGIDAALTTGQLAEQGPQLIVTDVDSTFITGEGLDLIAEKAGVSEGVSAITERAMAGELDFAASLRERLSLIEGADARLIDAARAEIRPSPGALRLVRLAHDRGVKIGLVSGGFHEVLDELVTHWGVDYLAANRMEIAGGKLTGKPSGPIIDRAAKAHTVRRWAAELGVPHELVVCAGDGANDLDMLALAGLGIAYNAKPTVREQADAAITCGRLDAIATMFGWEDTPEH